MRVICLVNQDDVEKSAVIKEMFEMEIEGVEVLAALVPGSMFDRVVGELTELIEPTVSESDSIPTPTPTPLPPWVTPGG